VCVWGLYGRVCEGSFMTLTLMSGWTNIRSDKRHFFAFGRTDFGFNLSWTNAAVRKNLHF
jgi:hypothetical protein